MLLACPIQIHIPRASEGEVYEALVLSGRPGPIIARPDGSTSGNLAGSGCEGDLHLPTFIRKGSPNHIHKMQNAFMEVTILSIEETVMGVGGNACLENGGAQEPQPSAQPPSAALQGCEPAGTPERHQY
jgi:hypothetical protein